MRNQRRQGWVALPRSHFTADALLRALACTDTRCVCHRAVVRGSGLTHCPAHDDRHPSLSVTDRGDRVLWNCKAGCDQRVVTAAIRQFFPDEERGVPDVKSSPGPARETVYDYGIARHIRLDFPDGNKRMWWEPAGIKMSDLPLWNGDMLGERRFDGEPVLLVEGEKDANRGVAFGFLAVSLPGGASQRDFGRALDVLAGRDVVLVPDQDKPGLALMEAVMFRLAEIGVARVRILTLDFPPPTDGSKPIHDLGDLLDQDADDDPVGARVAVKDMIEGAEVMFDASA